jgi:hypothetical protein
MRSPVGLPRTPLSRRWTQAIRKARTERTSARDLNYAGIDFAIATTGLPADRRGVTDGRIVVI